MSSELARRFIASVLGEYISNLNSDTISIGLWSGFVNCEELLINSSAFDRFNLPIKISYGKIGKIFLSLPIKSFLLGIASTVEITIEKVDLFIKTKADWSFFDYSNFEYKDKLLRRLTDDILLKIQIKQNPQLNDTYLNRTINYLIDNIQINIRDVTIIFEDTHSHLLYNMIGGIKIEKISVETNDCETGYISKSLQIDNSSLFIIPTKKNVNIKFDYNELSSGFNFIKDNSDVYNEINGTNMQLKDFFILSPLKGNLNLKRKCDAEVDVFDINIDIYQIELDLEKTQFICLLSLIRFIENYKQFFKNCYSLRHLNYNKPSSEKKHDILVHYFKGVLNLIKERKYNINFLSFDESSRKIFNKEFLDYYFNHTPPSNEFMTIIRFVDIEKLDHWIQLNIDSIYSYQNNHNGFFCGLKSYFYTNAIESIKLDNIINPKLKKINWTINTRIEFITFSLSNLGKNTSKVIFKEITSSMINFNQITAELSALKIIYIDKINNSYFTYRLLKPTNVIENAKVFKLKFSINDNQPELNIIFLAHTFTYHQNLVVSIISFFSVREFDEYANKLFDSSINDLLLRHRPKKQLNCAMNIVIENQQIVLPYKVLDECFLINLGDFNLLTDNSQKFFIELKKINVEFRSQIVKTKINLLDDFSITVNLLHQDKSLDISCKISNIKLNINDLMLSKLLTLKEIFSMNLEKDLWETKFTAKDLIYKNAIKREFILNLNSNGWERYYSLISGGYIYLFSSASDEIASLVIPLSNSIISDVKEIYNNHNEIIYYLEITSKEGQKYQIGFIHLNKTLLEWKQGVEKRIEEIKVSITFSQTPLQLTSIQSIAKTDPKITVKDYDKVINRIKAIINDNDSNSIINHREKTKYSIKLLIDLNSLNIYSSVNEMNTCINFFGLQLFFGQNDLFSYCDFSMQGIKFKHENVYLISNKEENKEKVLSLVFLLYNKDVFNLLFNQKFELDKINLDSNVSLFIKNISLMKLGLYLGEIDLLFEHKTVNNLIIIYNNIQKLITPSPIEEERKTLTNVKELSNSAVLLSLDMSIKYFGIMLLNKQSKLESFYFNLQKSNFGFKKKKNDFIIDCYLHSFGFFDVQTLQGQKKSLISTSSLLSNDQEDNHSIDFKYSSDNSGIDSSQLSLSYINIKYHHSVIEYLITCIKEELIPLFSQIEVTKTISPLIKATPKYRSLNIDVSFKQTKFILPDKFNENIYYALSIDNIQYESKNNVFKLKLINMTVVSSDNYPICSPCQFDLEIILSKDPDIDLLFNIPCIKFKFRRKDYLSIINIIDSTFGSSNHLQKENKENIIQTTRTNETDEMIKLTNLQRYKVKCHINIESLIVLFELSTTKTLIAQASSGTVIIRKYGHKACFNIKVKSLECQDNIYSLLKHSQNPNLNGSIEGDYQLIIQITEETLTKRLFIDVTLMDVKCLLKSDLYHLLVQFFDRRNQASFKANNPKKVKPPIRVNALISNTSFFLRNQDHFDEQELLALDLNGFLSYEINNENDQNNSIKTEQIKLQIQNMSAYLIKIMKVDAKTNYTDLHNKKIILEPMNIIFDMKETTVLKGLVPTKQIELYFFSNKIKVKLSFDDIFFINETIQFNEEYISLSFSSKQACLQSIEESIYVAQSFNNDNQIEAYIKLNSAEFQIVNETKESYRPHLMVNCDKMRVVLVKGADFSSQLKLYSNLQLNYFNYKTSIWEPFIESSYLEVFAHYSNGNINNILMNTPNQLNINITEEFVFSIIDSYKNIEYRLIKEPHRKLDKAIRVSNHMLSNFSGEDITIKSKESKTYIVKNGDTFDLEEINIDLIENIVFVQSGITIDSIQRLKFPLEISDNRIWYNVELQHMKKNYVFYGKYIIENNCFNKLVIHDSEKQSLLRNDDKLGVGELITIINNYQNSYKILLSDIKYLSYHKLDNLVINIEKLRLGNFQSSIYKFKILPTIIIQNCLEVEVIFEISQQIIVIEASATKHVFLNKISEDTNTIRPFKVKFKYKNYSFKSEDCSPPITKDNEYISNLINELDEPCILKVNSIEINGVVYLFIYFDYLIINSTPFDISPHESKLDFDFNGHHYFPVKGFEKLNLELNEANVISPLKEISVVYNNFAFFKEIEIKKSNRSIKLMFQRQLRYLKFSRIKKVDILLISQIIEQEEKRMIHTRSNSLLTRPSSTTSLSSVVSNLNETNDKTNTIIMTKPLTQIMLNINCINISLIASQSIGSHIERKELSLLSLNKIIFVYSKELRNQKEIISLIEVKMKDIQIDNMTNNPNSLYQVALCQVDTKSNVNFIQFKTEYKESSKYIYDISKIEFHIQPFGIFIDSEFSADILHFFFTFNDLIAGKIFYMENTNQILQSIKMVKIQKKVQKKIFINHIKTSHINFVFAYKNISNRLFDVLNIKSSIIQNVIDVFANSTHINIKLNSLEMYNVVGDRKDIINKFFDYYYFNLIQQAIKILFSIDILGNPFGLVEKLGKGVKDFFYLPIAGVINGPSEFFIGSFSGTKSLVFHALGGALDSTHKIASGIGTNILKLTNSDDYLQSRNNIVQQYTNMKRGKVSTAFMFIINGFMFGFKDFFTFPYVYYKRNGASSIIKGCLFGSTSIIIKPTSGLLDFLSFFSQNMAKRVLSQYDIQLSRLLKHRRENRIFWDEDTSIGNYDHQNELYEKVINTQNIIDIISKSIINEIHQSSSFQIKLNKIFLIKELKHRYKIIIFMSNCIVVLDAKSGHNDLMRRIKENQIEIAHIINTSSIIQVITSFRLIKIFYIDKIYRNRFCYCVLKPDNEDIRQCLYIALQTKTNTNEHFDFLSNKK